MSSEWRTSAGALFAWLGLLAACSRVGSVLEIRCASDADCPARYACAGDRCAPRAGADAGWTPGWVLVPAGELEMGSPTSEACRGADEALHAVRLTRDFELAPAEVTRGEFRAAMGYDPSLGSCAGDLCPVNNIDRHEAAAFCNALSSRASLPPCYACAGTGPSIACAPAAEAAGSAIYQCRGYRLPTEAEWEMAYRAGSTSATYAGDLAGGACSGENLAADRIGWYEANAQGQLHPARQLEPNALGLYDLAGNAWEWCHDDYVGDLGPDAAVDPVGSGNAAMGVGRGGGFDEPAAHLRAAFRNPAEPTWRDSSSGFRCCRSR